MPQLACYEKHRKSVCDKCDAVTHCTKCKCGRPKKVAVPISPEPLEGDVVEHGIKKAGISYKDCDEEKDLTSYRPTYSCSGIIHTNEHMDTIRPW